MDRFAELLSRLSAEHERLRQECEGLRADAEAWRAERPSCHKAFRCSFGMEDVRETQRAANEQPLSPTRCLTPPKLGIPRKQRDKLRCGWVSCRDGVKEAMSFVDVDADFETQATTQCGDASPTAEHSHVSIIDDAGAISVVSSVMSSPSSHEGTTTPVGAHEPRSGTRVRPTSRQITSLSQASVDPDDEEPEVRKPTLTFSSAQSQKSKKRCLAKVQLQGRAPDCRLWPVWVAHDSVDGGVEAIKLLACTSKKSSELLHCQQTHHVLQSSKGFLQKFVMAPSSRPRMAWDVMSSVVLSYDIVTVPLFAFVLHEELSESNILHLATTSFWTVDIVFSFFTGFHRSGMLEMRPSRIASRYLRGWFLLDFPVVALDWCASALLSGYLSDVVGILRVNKVVRVVRVLRVFRLLRMVKLPGWADALSECFRSESMSTAIGILRSLLIVSVASHYVACLWYFIGGLQSPSTWVHALEDGIRDDLSYCYVTALHWSLTQFTPASMEVTPKNTPERVFAIVVILSAMVAFSCFVSSITQAMASLQRSHAERDRQQDAMRRFFSENRISLELGGHISKFARTQNMMARRRVKEPDVQIFNLLPESLRQELHWEVYARVLSLHPLFDATLDLDDGFVQEVCHTAMSEVSLARYEELFHPGQESSCVYFTRSGTWEYHRHWDDAAPMEISGEKCVCEVALWLQWEIQGVLMAVTTCEAASLNAGKFHKIVASRPALLEALRVYASGYKARLEEHGDTLLAEAGFLPEMLHGIVEDTMQSSQQLGIAEKDVCEISESKGIRSLNMSRIFSATSWGSQPRLAPRRSGTQRRTERL